MEVVVCTIAKNENDYINEWCHHYIKLGFTHIYLYDNNDRTTPYIGDFIDKELQDKITIIDMRGIKFPALQQICYRQFYDKYDFDWMFFCDIDEFLIGIDNIQEFLSQEKFNPYSQIKIKWQLYNDSDLLERDITQPVMQSFTKLSDSALYKHRCMVKCLLRGHLPNVIWKSVHIATCAGVKTGLPTCLPSGIACSEKGCIDEHIEPYDDYSNETVFVNHYITKTVGEYLKNKYLTEDPCFIGRVRTLNYFWKYNKKTPEKEQFIDNYLKDNNIERVEKNAKHNT